MLIDHQAGKGARCEQPGAAERSARCWEGGRRRMRNQSEQKKFASNSVPLFLKTHIYSVTFAA